MKSYKVSRLSKGNKLFPKEIILCDSNLIISSPSLISLKERTIPYNRISSVSCETPVIGFSSITIETNGESSIIVSGFYKSDVLKIKNEILNKI